MNNESVRVQFPHNQETWDKVVTNSQENIENVDESSTTFAVDYASKDDFDKALTRFEGMVEFEELVRVGDDPESFCAHCKEESASCVCGGGIGSPFYPDM